MMSGDFDFEIGNWTVKHRKLKDFFDGKDDWIEFDGKSSTRKILGGQGNLEENLLEMPDGTFRAIALRTYEPTSGLWHIWWLDGRVPGAMDKPVVGKFHAGIGTFFADDVIKGKEVRIRFIWDARDKALPRWEQAFSFDLGKTWVTNWKMTFIPN